MGFYQELVLTCNLKEDCPQQVIDILNYMLQTEKSSTHDTDNPNAPDHYFFEINNDEWKWFLNDTYYFPGEPFAKLTHVQSGFYQLTLRTMIKYGDEMVAAFLHWLVPYSYTEGFVGYTRTDETPEIDLIYFEEGTAYYQEVEMWNTPPTVKLIKITERFSP
jgi:hypothetical protein